MAITQKPKGMSNKDGKHTKEQKNHKGDANKSEAGALKEGNRGNICVTNGKDIEI